LLSHSPAAELKGSGRERLSHVWWLVSNYSDQVTPVDYSQLSAHRIAIATDVQRVVSNAPWLRPIFVSIASPALTKFTSLQT
jgi:hypothetical protein